MAIGRISKIAVDALQPGARDQFLWDDQLTGFGVKITPRGKLVYLAQYRIGGRGSPTRRVTLGEHGKLTPAEARNEAKQVLSKASLREDVAETRAEIRRQGTLTALADRYLDEHVAARNKSSTRAEVERIVRKRIKPHLGTLKVGALTRRKVKEWHDSMRDTPYEANRALAYLSKMMSLASSEWDVVSENPCRGVRRFPERKRERFLTEAELTVLGNALRDVEDGGKVPAAFSAALRMLAMTGCRLSEILNLRWEDVDEDRTLLCLSDAKTGARAIPLAAPVTHLLESLDEHGPYVFPALSGETPMSRHAFHNYWAKVRDASGLNDVRPHDLRHTAGTYAAQAGFNAFLVRDFLGHRSLAMSGRYVERAVDPIRGTADAVSGRIADALDGRSGKKVVPMQGSEPPDASAA